MSAKNWNGVNPFTEETERKTKKLKFRAKFLERDMEREARSCLHMTIKEVISERREINRLRLNRFR